MNISSAQFDNLKTHITTVEQLFTWCSLVLQRTNPTLKVQENIVSEFACQVSLFQAEDETTRLTARFSIEFDPNYTTANPGKLWLSARPYAEMAIPASFLPTGGS
jgi:hypothetical protein